MQVDIIHDSHLRNLVRRVREALQDNRPVNAYTCLQDLDNYLHGKNMDGSLIKK